MIALLKCIFSQRRVMVGEAININLLLIWISMINSAPSTCRAFNTQFDPTSPKWLVFPLLLMTSVNVQIITVNKNISPLEIRKKNYFPKIFVSNQQSYSSGWQALSPDVNPPSISLHYLWTIEIIILYKCLSTKQFAYFSDCFQPNYNYIFPLFLTKK